MKIIIADDHDLVRDALSSLIKRDDNNAEIIAVSNFDEAYQALTETPEVSLILLDVYMPGMNNLLSVEKIVSDFPETPVVMMSGTVNHSDVQKCFTYGIRGFIPKTMNGKSLVSVLKMIIGGVKYIPEIMLETQADIETVNPYDLTQREQQILTLLFKGLPNKTISSTLFIEESTVKLHLRSLFKKFSAQNRTELVIKAIKAGYSDE